MNDTIKKSLIILVIFVIGAAIGRFSLPAKVIEKEKIVVQEKIVEKKIEIKNIKKKDHKIFLKVEKTLPDGTKTVETRIMDDKSEESDETKLEDKAQNKVTTEEKTKEATYAQQSTIISLMADSTFNNNLQPNLGLMVQKRVIGPVYLGGFAYTNKTFGLSLGLAF